MTNREIVDKYLENGLIDKCLDYQFMKIKDKQFKEDFRNDLILDLLTYEKLPQVEEEGHVNALITRVIVNNIFSRTSWYYRRYVRFGKNSTEITEREVNLSDEEAR